MYYNFRALEIDEEDDRAPRRLEPHLASETGRSGS
jgi:hypothetical protein